MGVNRVTLLGNVGREPELRQVGDNTVANFSLATTDRRFKDKDGKPRTEWHNVSAWGKLAEIIGQYVTKGTTLYLEGRIQTRSYDKDGVKVYRTEVIADQMEMLSKSDGDTKPKAQPYEEITEDDY